MGLNTSYYISSVLSLLQKNTTKNYGTQCNIYTNKYDIHVFTQ